MNIKVVSFVENHRILSNIVSKKTNQMGVANDIRGLDSLNKYYSEKRESPSLMNYRIKYISKIHPNLSVWLFLVF